MYFEDDVISALEPSAQRYSVRERRSKGFIVTVHPTGTRVFHFHRIVDGHKLRFNLGHWPSTSIKTARYLWRCLDALSEQELVNRAAGEAGRTANLPKPKPTPKPPKLTAPKRVVFRGAEESLSWAYRKFEASRFGKELRPATRKGYASHIYGFIERNGDIHIEDLTPQLVKADMRRQREVSTYAANRVKSALSSMCKWLVYEDYLEANPCTGLPRYKEKPRQRYLSEPELRSLLGHLSRSEVSGNNKAALRLYLLMAARGAELIEAKIEEFDLDNSRWTLPGARSKNHREHLIPLSETATTIFREVVDGRSHGYLFPSLRNAELPQRTWSINQSLTRLLDRAGIAHATLHDLRRTAATLIGSLGYDSLLIKKILNHAPVGVTDQVYALYDYQREKLEAMEMLAMCLEDWGL